jgi:phage-related protein
MKIVKGAFEYIFPTYSALSGRNASVRGGSTARAYSHGGIPTGDGKFDTAKPEISVTIEGTSEADYLTKINALKGALYRTDYKLYITDTQYINIAKLDNINEEFYAAQYWRQSEVKAILLATDPFIYDDTGISDTEAVAENPHTYTVNNPGNVDTPAVITITAAAACTSIKITNVTDGGRLFTYADASMLTGQVLTVDAVVGTVKRGTSNTLNNFAGAFLSLLPGDNTLTYEGGACEIQITAGKRWIL